MSEKNTFIPKIIFIFAITVIFVGVMTLTFDNTPVALAQDPDETPTPNLPDTPYNYSNITLPDHFTANQIASTDNTPNNNSITDQGATLGRVLFYDTNLSIDQTVSCASCHQQAHGFSDPDQFSAGISGQVTGRNSMGLANARFFEPGTFFWDERAATLEDQVLLPIQSPVEMGLTLAQLQTRVENLSYYPPLFEDAFGTDDVTTERISRALAQFIRSMVAYQSKYDEGVDNNFSNFTAAERAGRQIFEGRGRCDNCHGTDAFIVEESHNIGLDATTTDRGLGEATGNTNDDGKFKVPSLRNVALTAPYMHDGRFATLEEVVEHYNSGVQNHPNLDNQLQQGAQPRRLNLNDTQKANLVAFLHTLTDQSLQYDVRFSD
ncbi:MAG: cytochrome c peroxidase, partial [Chloroflexota bacterium]